MKHLLNRTLVLFCIACNSFAGSTQIITKPTVPTVANETERLANLQRQWKALHETTPQLGVRDCFQFLLDAIDTKFITQEEFKWTVDKVMTRVITDSTAPSYGNMYWGWTETGGDVGDGNNVEFCLQYGLLIKLFFDDRLSDASRASLDKLFDYAGRGALRYPVRVSYTNIYVMRVWNLIALGQIYHQPKLLEEGKKAFDNWLKHLAQNGNREYDSPTYCGVDLESLLFLKYYANDAEVREKASDAVNFFLTDLCAHYNKKGGYLAGAHSRDYNRVFGRDLLEESYFNPFLGGPDPNYQLFSSTVLTLLKQTGLTPLQKKLLESKHQFIVQKWDSFPHVFAYEYKGEKFSIASSNQYYSPDDKSFVIYLHSKKHPALPNIVYVPEGRNDPYGTWSQNSMGDKMKHLMPPNYPANGGWGKTRHLMPFQQTAQRKNEFVMLVAGEKDHNCITDQLNSTVLLPNYFDELWLGNEKIQVPDSGQSIAFNHSNTLFARFEDVVVGFKILWSNADSTARPVLYNDGFEFRSNRVKGQLAESKTLRFTLQHPSKAPLKIAMWWKVQEGINSSEAFAQFRNEMTEAPVSINHAQGKIDIAVSTPQGLLGLKADLNTKTRMEYYGSEKNNGSFLFKVNGKEIGQPMLRRYLMP